MSKILKPTLGWLAVLAWSGTILCAGEAKTPAGPKAGEGKSSVIVPAGSTQRAVSPEARTSFPFKGESLKVVLDFLSTRSGLNIRALDDKDLDIKVTFTLENVTWREALSFMAEKYGLMVDDSREAQGLIVVKSPPKVSIIFDKPTDIRTVIATIADQSGANIIMGSEKEITGKVSLSLKDVPWEEALSMVVRTLNFVAIKDKFNTYRITTPDKLAQQLETRVFRLSYIQPEGNRYMATIKTEYVVKEQSKASGGGASATEPVSLIGMLKSIATDKVGKINYVRDSNTLVVTDTPDKLEAMQRLIEKMDIPPKQVHMALRMITLSDSESEALGVEWTNGFTGSMSGMGFDTAFPFDASTSSRGIHTGRWWGQVAVDADSFRTLSSGVTPATVNGQGVTLGRLDFTALTATLNFLKTRTKASTIQSPSLTALDNQEATIHVGKNIRYAEFDSNSTNSGTTSGYKEAANSPIQEGIQILIIPHVTGPDGNVLMTIVVKSEDLDGWQTFGGVTGISLPQTTERVVVTKELLRDAETGVIGGLKITKSSMTEKKIPFLGDIPGLGWLFKSRIKSADNNLQSNLLIFLTPTVIDVQQDSRVPKEVRDIRRGLAGPFFTYDEKVEGEEPVKAGGGK